MSDFYMLSCLLFCFFSCSVFLISALFLLTCPCGLPVTGISVCSGLERESDLGVCLLALLLTGLGAGSAESV